MTTTILRPNGSISSAGVTFGGGAGTAHTATEDDVDATYVAFPGWPAQDAVMLDLTTVALPAGALTKTITVRLRGVDIDATGAGACSLRVRVYAEGALLAESHWTFPLTIGTATVLTFAPPALTQAEVDALRVEIWATNNDHVPDGFRIHEVYLDLVHATQPTVALTAPTGTITTTSSPVATWTHTLGSDGGPQSRYHVRVFSAAEYGIGGFDPDTSPATYDSGGVYGAATSHVIGPLSDATTYRVYVWTAQTINGQPHWSEPDFETIVTDFALPEIDSVVAVGDDANARMVLVVDRVVAVPDWETLTVERSDDAGVTWTFVRGATAIVAPAGDIWTGYDYEAGNGVTMLYRARSATSVFTSEWVELPAASWSSADDWIKDPGDPSLNTTVIINSQPALTRPRQQGVHRVLGRSAPVVVSDVLGSAQGRVVMVTLTDAAADGLLSLLGSEVVLLQTPATERFGSRYLAVGEVAEIRTADIEGEPSRYWDVPFNEVDRPVDSGIAAVTEFVPLTWAEASMFTWSELAEAFPTWADVT